MVLLNTYARWPEHVFTGAVVPTVVERSQALASLGFVFTDGAEWSWTEDSTIPGDEVSPVVLIAATRVRSLNGGVS